MEVYNLRDTLVKDGARTLRMVWRPMAWLWLGAFMLAGCGARTAPPLPPPNQTPAAVAASPAPASASATEIPPTATPEPLAAVVNSAPIPLAAYEREVERCRAGKDSAGLDSADCPAAALRSLVEQLAVEQAAEAAGVVVSEDETEAAVAKIVAGLGGPEGYAAWLARNLYSETEFRQALRRDLARARLVARVTAEVGDRAEQVRARQLLVADEAAAQNLLGQIQAGADFAALAVAHSLDLSSRPAGGDLGWFPRGLLTVPEVAAAAFSLQPGETSGVIRSALGFHIVQTLERDPARPLSPAAEQALRARAFEAWLQRLLAEAVIEYHINP